jgi:hypothetical protein
MIRFLHTADLHLGNLFGRFPENLRSLLGEAQIEYARTAPTI